MYIEIEDQLEGVAALVVQQQGINFASWKEAQSHLKKITGEMRHLVEQSNEKLIKGLNCLAANGHGHVHSYVADMSAKLLKHVDSAEKLNKIIQFEIWRNENALLFFSEAAESYIDRGDLEQEQCVIAVLMALFPFNPQPYVYFGSSIWRHDGIEIAAAFYAEIIKVTQDPALYYYAADCFYKKGDKSHARETLRCALELAQNSPELYGDLEQLIVEFIQKF